MKRFTVNCTRIVEVYEAGEVTIDADSEEEAQEIAERMAQQGAVNWQANPDSREADHRRMTFEALPTGQSHRCADGERRPLYDARRIFCCYVCDRCEASRRREFRAEIFTNGSYDHDEPIDGDFFDDL